MFCDGSLDYLLAPAPRINLDARKWNKFLTPYLPRRYLEATARKHAKMNKQKKGFLLATPICSHPTICESCRKNITRSSFRLRTETYHLPKALHAHLQRANFDPHFIANLISRRNPEEVVEDILDTGCTFAITPDRRDVIEYHIGAAGNVETSTVPP